MFTIQRILESSPTTYFTDTRQTLDGVTDLLRLTKAERQKLKRHTLDRTNAGLEPITTLVEHSTWVAIIKFSQI